MAHVASYIVLAHDTEQRLAEAFDLVGEHHGAEAEIRHGARTVAALSRENVAALEPLRARYDAHRDEHAHHEPERFFTEPLVEPREGPIGLVRDLQDLLTLTAFATSAWTVVDQGAKAMKDDELEAVCERALRHNEEQSRWLKTKIKTAAPQALLFAQ